MSILCLPILRKACRATLGHLDEGERLPTGDQYGVVSHSSHFEGAPKPDALDGVQPALDHKFIAEYGGLSVINFCSQNDRVELCLRHFAELHAELCGQTGSRSFDHSEVGEVVHDAAAVGVEKHDFFVGLNGRGLRHAGALLTSTIEANA